MTTLQTSARQTGWGYSDTGTPCAYILDLDEPDDATVIEYDTWWQAMRCAVIFAYNNCAEYVGGPE